LQVGRQLLRGGGDAGGYGFGRGEEAHDQVRDDM
jgi:hypothetical protein